MYMCACHWASSESGRLRAKEKVLIMLPSAVRENVIKCGLLCLVSDCDFDPVDMISAFERAGEIKWTAPDCVGWFLYNFAGTSTISVPEWQAEKLRRGLRGSALLGVAHAKVAPCYVESFRDVGITEQRVFLQNMDTERHSDVPKEIDDEEDNRKLESMVTVEKVATSGICGKLQEAQHTCNGGGESVTSATVDIIEQACESLEMERKNATVSSSQADFKTKPLAKPAAVRTMRS